MSGRFFSVCRRSIACLMTALICFCAARLPAFAETEVYRSVKTNSMKIALTFDDGPHPHQTERILDTLDQYGIKATFFMVGVNVQNYPEAARDVLKRGHEVGNHTFSHPLVAKLDQGALEREMGACEDVLEELCEYRPHLFRPPEGALTSSVSACTEQGDYSLVLWSLDTRDWEVKNTEKIVQTVLSRVQAGDIILMHDYIGVGSKTPEALAILLPELIARGYEPVTVSELLSGD